MKKLLLYAALVILFISSVGMLMAATEQLLFLMQSMMLAGAVMMVAAAILDETARIFSGLYGMMLAFHLIYINAGGSMAPWIIMFCAFSVGFSLFMLWWANKIKTSPWILLSAGLFAKICLIPEEILNLLLTQASGDSTFTAFSWLMLIVTSAYSLMAIYQMYKQDQLAKPAALVLAIMQAMFVTDILASFAAWCIALKERKNKPAPVVKKDPIYSKSSFSNSRRRGKPVRK